jgi:uncharacterized phage protein gp47/JayE
MLSVKFLERLGEQVAIAGVGAFVAVLAASDGSVTKSVIVAGISAAVRVVYGIIVHDLGDPEQPSAVK